MATNYNNYKLKLSIMVTFIIVAVVVAMLLFAVVGCWVNWENEVVDEDVFLDEQFAKKYGPLVGMRIVFDSEALCDGNVKVADLPLLSDLKLINNRVVGVLPEKVPFGIAKVERWPSLIGFAGIYYVDIPDFEAEFFIRFIDDEVVYLASKEYGNIDFKMSAHPYVYGKLAACSQRGVEVVKLRCTSVHMGNDAQDGVNFVINWDLAGD